MPIRNFGVLLILSSSAVLGQGPLMDAVMKNYAEMKENILLAASAVPQEKYGYRLTPAQFSFMGWLKHSVIANYYTCYHFGGMEPPPRDTLRRMNASTDKKELEEVVKSSFDYCDAALTGMNDVRAMTAITVEGKKESPVTNIVIMLTSLNEHYGNIVGYLRTLGITPPSTTREEREKKEPRL